jgi:D-sedoheptulose 7-phosphate isomerase
METSMQDVLAAIREHQSVIAHLEPLAPQVRDVGRRLAAVIAAGGKILLMGNGGSAADAQHLAAELVGRFKRERRALAAIALTTDTSILTSVGNDYGFNRIFSRQVEALCAPVDAVIGLSTSGDSENVLEGIRAAKAIGAYTVGVSGPGGRLRETADACFAVDAPSTARIQEAHILIGHIICDIIEAQAAVR